MELTIYRHGVNVLVRTFGDRINGPIVYVEPAPASGGKRFNRVTVRLANGQREAPTSYPMVFDCF